VARIAGVNLPLNKRSEIGLTYIYGIGRSTANKILTQVGVSPDTYVRDLTEDEVAKLRDAIDEGLSVEGDLRRERSQDIKRLQEIGCYRGMRHRRGLPVRGQKTKTNARTRKGPKRMQVAGKKKAGKKGPPLPVVRPVVAASRRRTSPSARLTSRLRSTTRSSRSPTPRATSSPGNRLAGPASRARARRPPS